MFVDASVRPRREGPPSFKIVISVINKVKPKLAPVSDEIELFRAEFRSVRAVGHSAIRK